MRTRRTPSLFILTFFLGLSFLAHGGSLPSGADRSKALCEQRVLLDLEPGHATNPQIDPVADALSRLPYYGNSETYANATHPLESAPGKIVHLDGTSVISGAKNLESDPRIFSFMFRDVYHLPSQREKVLEVTQAATDTVKKVYLDTKVVTAEELKTPMDLYHSDSTGWVVLTKSGKDLTPSNIAGTQRVNFATYADVSGLLPPSPGGELAENWGLLSLEVKTGYRIPEHRAYFTPEFHAEQLRLIQKVRSSKTSTEIRGAVEELILYRMQQIPPQALQVAETGRLSKTANVPGIDVVKELKRGVLDITRPYGIDSFYLMTANPKLEQHYAKEYGAVIVDHVTDTKTGKVTAIMRSTRSSLVQSLNATHP